MCCSVSNFNILNNHVGLLSHHTVIIIRLGTLLPGQPGWEYTRRKSILIKILTLLEYNCVCGSRLKSQKNDHFFKLSVSKNVSVTCICFLEFVVRSLSCVQLFATPWTAARQASLFFTMSQSLLKFMSTEPMTPSNHLILCLPLLLPPSIFPSIRVFSSESVLHIRWSKY